MLRLSFLFLLSHPYQETELVLCGQACECFLPLQLMTFSFLLVDVDIEHLMSGVDLSPTLLICPDLLLQTLLVEGLILCQLCLLLLDRFTQLDRLLVSFDDLKLPEIQLSLTFKRLFNGLLQVQSSLEQSICAKCIQGLLFINFLEANFLPEGLLLELFCDAPTRSLALGKFVDIANAYMPSLFLGSTNFFALGHRDVLF